MPFPLCASSIVLIVKALGVFKPSVFTIFTLNLFNISLKISTSLSGISIVKVSKCFYNYTYECT